jgi:hypothetical protein
VGRARASVASTWPIGSAGVLTGAAVRAATAWMPARASRGALACSTVPQAWHSPHRPVHLGACQPHSLQRYPAAPVDDFAMPAP